MTFYNLVRLQDTGGNRDAYGIVRNATSTHQNAFFDLIDRALNGPSPVRDAETLRLLTDWLQRPQRESAVDLSKIMPVCGSETCTPVPVPLRATAEFLWQIDPFQVSVVDSGTIEGSGIDYILPYWMARYYNVAADENQAISSAAAIAGVSAGSLASLYGSGLASFASQAAAQPLPLQLGGVSALVTDPRECSRPAGLVVY